jgi:hypothetical protein
VKYDQSHWRCSRIRVAAARLDECFDLRTIEIASHHPHAFAVAPVELAVPLIEMDSRASDQATIFAYVTDQAIKRRTQEL